MADVAATTHLDHIDGRWVLGLVVAFVLLAGVVVAFGRRVLEGKAGDAESKGRTPDKTLIRAWIAVSLVGGLLIFCGASFGIDDSSLRSTLLGGLVASSGSAVSYYFASKAAAQSTQAIINAAGLVSTGPQNQPPGGAPAAHP